MAGTVPQQVALTGFFTSQGWLLNKSLDELERLLGYRAGRLSTAGAAVYGFTRVPEEWEFELAGYTNVPGGIKPDPGWIEADRAAAGYYAASGMRNSDTVRKNAARCRMTITGRDRLVKIKPLLPDPPGSDPRYSYPPGEGIQQWRVSDKAEQRGTLTGILLTVIQPGARYPK